MNTRRDLLPSQENLASFWLLGEEDKVSSPSVAIVSATPTRPDYRIGFASRRNLPNSPPLSQPP